MLEIDKTGGGVEWRESEREVGWEADRQTDRQTFRERGWQTDRLTDRQK